MHGDDGAEVHEFDIVKDEHVDDEQGIHSVDLVAVAVIVVVTAVVFNEIESIVVAVVVVVGVVVVVVVASIDVCQDFSVDDVLVSW